MGLRGSSRIDDFSDSGIVHIICSLVAIGLGRHLDSELAGDDSLFGRARAVCYDLRVVQVFVGETSQRLCVETGSLTNT